MTGRPAGSHTDLAHSGAAGGRARGAADRARIDEVFGETLPETTSDETRGRDGRIHDDWWREQRPPHHG